MFYDSLKKTHSVMSVNDVVSVIIGSGATDDDLVTYIAEAKKEMKEAEKKIQLFECEVKRRKNVADRETIKVAKALWNQLMQEQKTLGNKLCWFHVIALAGIYLENQEQCVNCNGPIFTWHSPAEVPVAEEVYRFLTSRGVECQFKEGTYD